MPKQAAGLSYAVRFPLLGKYFGQLCLVVAALYLGEVITLNLIVGAGLVIAGVALTERG